MTGSVRYCIKHTSRYMYSSPVSKSAMTLCFRPREDDGQSLLSFEIETIPAISLTSETDYFGNIKHFLIVHQPHELLEITALSTVEPGPRAPLPESLAPETWAEIQAWRDSVEYWDFMHPSRFARSCPELSDFMSGHGLDRPEGDPLGALVRLSGTLVEHFQYVPGSTSAVSPNRAHPGVWEGRLPGLRTRDDIDCPFMGFTVPLRIGLFVCGGRCRSANSGSGRTCLGGMPAPRAWVGGFRPDEQLDCRPTARAGCGGSGLSRRGPDSGDIPRGWGYKAGG